MARRPRFDYRHRGFSVTELLVTIGVVALLVSISVPLYETFQERARKARCISNLRNIHAGLLGYLTDKGHWPQMEEDKYDFTEKQFFEFWVDATEPYGCGEDAWACPSDRALDRLSPQKRKTYIGSYVTTRFDKKAQTPLRWNQPWVIERGDFHGQGQHILLPDGSVQSALNPFHGR